MTKTNRIDSKNNHTLKGLRHPLEYNSFVIWTATPEPLREPQTQRELASTFGVGEDTLSEWKQRNGFWDAVHRELRMWSKSKTPNIIHALYKKAQNGNAAEVKLWLQYVEGFSEKSTTEIRPSPITPEIDELITKIYGKKRNGNKKETLQNKQ